METHAFLLLHFPYGNSCISLIEERFPSKLSSLFSHNDISGLNGHYRQYRPCLLNNIQTLLSWVLEHILVCWSCCIFINKTKLFIHRPIRLKMHHSIGFFTQTPIHSDSAFIYRMENLVGSVLIEIFHALLYMKKTHLKSIHYSLPLYNLHSHPFHHHHPTHAPVSIPNIQSIKLPPYFFPDHSNRPTLLLTRHWNMGRRAVDSVIEAKLSGNLVTFSARL